MTEEPSAFHNTFNGDNRNVVQAGRIEEFHLHGGPAPVGPREGPLLREFWIGRDRDLDILDEALSQGKPVVLGGGRGMGATAVAAMAIERNRERYPDGQIYIDLDSEEVSQALLSVLIRLNVPPDQVPAGIEGRVSAYRSVTRNRALLVVVDGVTREREAALFQPAFSRAGYLVVARVALDETYFVHELEPLESDAAAEYLRQACPNLSDGVAPRLVDEFGGRPADLRALAGLIRQGDLSGLVEVREAVGDDTLRHSAERVLGESARWLYRLLATLPNREFERSLTGIFTGARDWALEAVPPPLGELIEAQIVTEHRPGWYRIEPVPSEERPDPRAPVPVEIFSARRDSLVWHVRRAQLADRAVMGARARFAPDLGRRVNAPGFSGPAEAMEWFRALHASLAVSVRIAAEHRWGDEAWALSEALWAYFSNAKQYREAVDCYRSALAVADGSAAEAQLSALLGLSLIGCEEFTEAGEVLDRGLAAAYEHDRSGGDSRRLTELIGIVTEQLGRLRLLERRLDEADEFIDTAIACAERIERPRAVAIRLRVRAEIFQDRGDDVKAELAWQRAAEIFDAEGDERNLLGTRLDILMLRFTTRGGGAELSALDKAVTAVSRTGLWQLAAETLERIAQVPAEDSAPRHGAPDLNLTRETCLERALRLYEAHGAFFDADRVRHALGLNSGTEH